MANSQLIFLSNSAKFKENNPQTIIISRPHRRFHYLAGGWTIPHSGHHLGSNKLHGHPSHRTAHTQIHLSNYFIRPDISYFSILCRHFCSLPDFQCCILTFVFCISMPKLFLNCYFVCNTVFTLPSKSLFIECSRK